MGSGSGSEATPSEAEGEVGLDFTCPQCGAPARVTQVQGDRCPSCGFEFKWFASGEERTAHDYLAVLTRRKHLLPLEGEDGFIVAHE